jgi:uncharacterized protein YyaL (SSP411 family)
MSELHFSPRPNKAANIHWQAWGDAPFAQAKAQGKPVLLAISAVWCHWCHVMDETSYSNDSVIETINSRFVPVRVDNDQRPDINARYNMGGWPTTAFLTPEGEVLYGATYLPPDAMLQALQQIDLFFSDPGNRETTARRSAELQAARVARARSPQGSDLDPLTAANVLAAIAEAFDEKHGGFGTEQKFPHVDAIDFLLDVCSRGRDDRAQHMALATLRAMTEGGMYDHVEGGFFRYSTTPDFSVPHFEKMLEDNSGLLLACARAGALFNDASLSAIAVDVKRYMDEWLWSDDTGAYGGSQDADEEYYALGAAARAKAKPPYVDHTVYTAWNGEAAGSLLFVARVLDREGADSAAWQTRATRVLELLWTHMLQDGMMCRFNDGEPRMRGLLIDQIWPAWAALAAFSSTADPQWLQRASDLISHADALFDPAAQVYLDRLRDASEPGRAGEPTVSFEENSLMARVLLRYATASGRTEWAERARAILRRYARDYPSYQIFAATYARAVLDALQPPLRVYVVGAADDLAAVDLRDAALRVATPRLDVIPLDPKLEHERAAALGYDATRATAFVCSEDACFARATTTQQLAAALAAPTAPSLSLTNAAHKE